MVTLLHGQLMITLFRKMAISSIFNLPSSSPKYFGDSESSSMCFTAAWHPNIRKNGDSLADSVGKKLYTDVALATRSSHSSPLCSCLPMVAFKNLWNPSILPLHCGE